ncbi:hypothetical protein PG994_006536 [Apiospora phragmitis]|uniref:Uncharacterized protein n=1 Tax=Apiospora phragmitis TaxID=2905665 RepID=A0ABR1VI58_9PEZI
MEGQDRLCAYCSKLDFSMLQRPTRGQLVALNNGNPPADGYPLGSRTIEYETGHSYQPLCSLGLQSRIDQEQSCPLRDDIRRVLVQHPQITATWGSRRNDAVCIAKFDGRATLKPPSGVEWEVSYAHKVYNLSLHWIVIPDDQNLAKPGLVPYAVAKD